MAQIKKRMLVRLLNQPWLWAVLIALAAFGLRIVVVGYGLPLLLYEDEPIYYQYALDFGLGHWHSDYFKKPGFFLYFYAFFYQLGYWWQTLFSRTPPAHWWDYVEAFRQNPAYVVIIGRTISITLATATVARLGQLGIRLFGLGAGLTAALWLAADPTHLHISPVVIADIPSLFCIVMVAWFAVDVYETGRWRDYLLCALFIALAISFKYNVFTVVFLLTAHAFGRWKDAGPSWTSRQAALLGAPRFWTALAGIPALFFLLNPMTLFHFSAFQDDLALEKNHMMLRHAQAKPVQWRAMAAFSAIFFHILPKALGWPVYILGLAGLPWILRRHPIRNRIVFSFPLVFLLVVLQFQLINAKYLLPVMVFWYLAAAVFLNDLITRLIGLSSRLVKNRRLLSWSRLCPVSPTSAVYIGAVLLLAIPSWLASLRHISIYTRPDVRQIAAKALRARARPNDRVLLEPDTLTLDPRVIRSGWQLQNIQETSLPRLTGSAFFAPVSHSFQDIALRPRYVLINLGTARKKRDTAGQTVYEMPYSTDYYRTLQEHYQLKSLFSPYKIAISPFLMRHQWKTLGFPGLYASIQQHKSGRLRPGPLLALMERRSTPGRSINRIQANHSITQPLTKP